MPEPPAVMGAMMQCSFGLAPSSMMVSRPNILIEGRPAANVMDITPTNIPPFVLCQSLANPAVAAATAAAMGTLTPAACTPLLVGPWSPTAPTTKVAGESALAAGATAHCAYGGVISITLPGATRTTVG